MNTVTRKNSEHCVDVRQKLVGGLIIAAALLAGVVSPGVVSAQEEDDSGRWFEFDTDMHSVWSIAQHPNGTFYSFDHLDRDLRQMVEWTQDGWVPVAEPFVDEFPSWRIGHDGNLYLIDDEIMLWTGSEFESTSSGYTSSEAWAGSVRPFVIASSNEVYGVVQPLRGASTIRYFSDGTPEDLPEVPFNIHDLGIGADGNLVVVGLFPDASGSVVWAWGGVQWSQIGDVLPFGHQQIVVMEDGSLIVGPRSKIVTNVKEKPVPAMKWDGEEWRALLGPDKLWAPLGSDGCGNVMFEDFPGHNLKFVDADTGQLVKEAEVAPAKPQLLSGLDVEGYHVFSNDEEGRQVMWLNDERPVATATDLEDLLKSCDYDSNVQGDVLRLYQAFFDRTPDLAGAKYWLRTNTSGYRLDQIAESFALSEEFTNDYAGSSNAEYLEAVYENVLGRAYDQAGFDYWLGLLDSGHLTRGGVVRWVAANDEFRMRHPF